jgi:tRNA A22 N-methylase
MMSKAREIAQQWVDYAQRNNIKRNTIKYGNHQQAYITGVFACLGAETPPIITIYGMTGRDLAEIVKEEATA